MNNYLCANSSWITLRELKIAIGGFVKQGYELRYESVCSFHLYKKFKLKQGSDFLFEQW